MEQINQEANNFQLTKKISYRESEEIFPSARYTRVTSSSLLIRKILFDGAFIYRYREIINSFCFTGSRTKYFAIFTSLTWR